MAALLVLLATMTAAHAGGSARPQEAALWRGVTGGGHVVLLRHALAPGTGDPSGFRLGQCASQRNLSDAGRKQAAAIGARFRDRGAHAVQVYSSRWCRSLETARLLDLGPVTALPALDSFFGGRGSESRQTAQLRLFLARRRGGPTLVLVTHQVNITALTGVIPRSGEMLVLRNGEDGLQLVGRLAAPPPTPG